MGSMVGAAVVRKEDPALLTGRGTYVDDVRLPGTVHMAYVRSYLAHARILSIDTTDAAARPGVLGVWTNADLDGLPPNRSVPGMERPCLARDKVLAADGEMSPVQEGFRQCHGLQCGYCTSGMVMAATGLL